MCINKSYETENLKVDDSVNKIIANRTDYLTIVLENVYQQHNSNSVVRTCESLGIKSLHVIENNNKFIINGDLSLGAEKYIDITRYNSSKKNNTQICLEHLKSLGYKIVATTPHNNDYEPDNLPIDNKLAIVFGTELEGLSKDVIDNADMFMKIPMYGFTESLNISVSMSIIAYELIDRIHKSNLEWQLSDEKRNKLLNKYLSRNNKND